MADKPRRVYWDTSCFLCFLNKRETERRLICNDILNHAKAGDLVLYTSTLTIAEVVYPKRSTLPKSRKLNPTEVQKISGMWKWKYLKKVNVDQKVSERASEICRDFDMLPNDAIHAATAEGLQVDALQKWDRDFSKIAHLVNVEEPKRISKQEEFPGMRGSLAPTPEDFSP